MYWVSTEDRLPEEGEYVLARHVKNNWLDNEYKQEIKYVVVKLVKGISKIEREEMKSEERINPEIEMINPSRYFEYVTFKRSDIIFPEDEDGNNFKSYKWESSGSQSYYGQEISHWTTIKPIK